MTGSNVGVMMAPRMKETTTAYRRCFARNSGVTTPILDRKKATSGVSNTMPIQKSSVIIRLV